MIKKILFLVLSVSGFYGGALECMVPLTVRCEPGSSRIEIYASIASDLMVSFYAKKSGAADPAQSMIFNLIDIINNEVGRDFSDLYAEAEKICQKKELYTIAAEATGILTQDLFGSLLYDVKDIPPSFINMFNCLAQKVNLAPDDQSVEINFNPKAPVFLRKERGCKAIIELSPEFLREKCDNEQNCTLANVLMDLKQVYLKTGKDEKTMRYIADIATVLATGNPCYAVYLHKNSESDFRKILMLTAFECYKKAIDFFV